MRELPEKSKQIVDMNLQEKHRALQAEFELLEAVTSRYRGMLDTFGDLVCRRDETGKLTFVNNTYTLASGLPRNEILGTAFDFPPVEPPKGLTADSEQSSPEGLVIRDQWIETIVGRRCFSWQAVPMPMGIGIHNETLFIGRDVTDRLLYIQGLDQARQEAEHSTKMKSNFVATITHEIRTPLNGVIGLTDLMLETSLTPEQENYGKLISSSANSLLMLVDEVLDLEKINSGNFVPQVEAVDLEAMVIEIAELMAPRAQEKDLEFALCIDPALKGRLLLDAKRFRQIIINLAGNAIKFTDKGGIGLYLRQEEAGPQQQAMIECRVVDTGMGISEENQQRIFEAFERVEDRDKAREGTGLGLAISRRLARLLNGDIQMSSELGQGAEFVFTLPFRPEEQRSRKVEKTPLSGYKLILHTPSRTLAETLGDQSDLLGATIVDPGEAHKVIGSPVSHLIDFKLGFFGVRNLVQKIKSEAPVGQDVKILVLLSPFERSQLSDLREAGADGYLVKPLRPASLVTMVTSEDAASPASRSRQEAERKANWSPDALHVLVAEDNDINALLIQSMLERIGVNSTRVRDGEQAVQTFAEALDDQSPFAFLVLDLRMPNLDGGEAIRQIRLLEAEKGTQRCPAICLTASAHDKENRYFKEIGFDAMVQKPIDPAELTRLITLLTRPTLMDESILQSQG